MARIFEKFIVLKNADAEKYLTDEEFKILRSLQKKILTGRMSDGKMQNIAERLKQKKTDAFERLFDGGSRGIGFCEAIKIVKEEGEINGENL